MQSIQAVMEQINQIILGKNREIREVMLAFLANGHVLLEDIPGVGKTTLALAFSRAMSLDYRRVQFTPDVMPSDLTGFSVYRREEEKFVYQPGVVFCNLLLADELNRTSPKTQSALLEIMEERKVTVEGVTRPAPEPFLVIATQNPYGAFGAQPLPEAQVDRFLISLTLGYPDFESELAPLNWDPADYFLFVGRRGYCQHYALTATLLYRLYGIPARYAAGYRVAASDFTRREDGRWQAVVTDREAHAWVELFLEDYGWTPVEVTPATDGSIAAVYPGFDRQVFRQQLSRWGWNEENSSSEKPEAPMVTFPDPAQALSALRAGFRAHKGLWRSLRLCLLCSLPLGPAALVCRRLWKRKKLKTMDCQRVYARLLEMLHFGGFLLTCDGSEKDFAKLLSRELPSLPPKDLARAWYIVVRTAYGQEPPSKEEEELVRSVYRQAAQAVYPGLNQRRKLLFRYRKAF